MFWSEGMHKIKQRKNELILVSFKRVRESAVTSYNYEDKEN